MTEAFSWRKYTDFYQSRAFIPALSAPADLSASLVVTTCTVAKVPAEPLLAGECHICGESNDA